MTIYQGTLPHGSGSMVAYTKVASSSPLFADSLRRVASARINIDGSYRLPLTRAGEYVIRISTAAAFYPEFTVTAANGGSVVALTGVSTPTLRNRPTVPVVSPVVTSPSKSRVETLADTLGQTSATKIDVSGTDVSGGGYAPTLEPENIIKTGVSPGQAAYRSEVTLPTSTYVRATEGQRVTTEFELNLSLAFSDQPSSSWNVVFQQHGRLWDQTWPNPPVELNFQNGSYRLSSSFFAPNAEGVSIPAFNEAQPRLWIPQPLGTWHLWKISTVLGGAGCGFVDVWCDGEQVVHQWFPKSGTMYIQPEVPGQSKPNGQGSRSDFSHEWIYTKIGLYGAGTHTKHRVVQHRNVRFTVMGLNNTTTYTM